MELAATNPGEGPSVWVVGDRYTIKAGGERTGGAYALIEAMVPPGGGPPPHRHTREDESFYVLEGSVRFEADGRAFDAGAGSWITLPRGSLHHFRNVGPGPARMLILVAPAGLERFFLEVGRPATGDPGPSSDFGPEEVAALLAVAPAYGIEIPAPAEGAG